MRSPGAMAVTTALLALVVQSACTGPSEAERAAEMAKMKEEIRREVLDELQAKGAGPAAPARPEAAAAAPAAVDPAKVGSASGRVLVRGAGLANCQIKLVRLVEPTSLIDAFKTFQEGSEFNAVSGADGSFSFSALPAGSYCVKWLPKGESGWIRKLSDKPDVVVTAGVMTQLGDVDLRNITIVGK